MRKIVRIILMAIPLVSASTAFAETRSSSTKASASLVASCNITATNVNLGMIVLPLTNQAASSGKINVLCNNKATYKIDLAYGGVYGTGTSDPNQVLVSKNNGQAVMYNVTTSTYGSNTFSVCGYAGCIPTGYKDSGVTTACLLTGGLCAVYDTGSTFYNYGVLNGASKGDKIGYYIGLPNDNSKVWNTGNYSYSGTGTGITEELNFKVNVVINKSSSLYPAPDIYTDAVTAKVSF